MTSFLGTSRSLSTITKTAEEVDTNKRFSPFKWLTKKDPISQLEELIDIEQSLDRFRNNRVKLLEPKTLYNQGIFDRSAIVFRTYREEAISVISGSENIELISVKT